MHKTWLIFALSLTTVVAHATELDGTIKGVKNGKVTVTCGTETKSRTLDSSGRYRFADLPDNSACEMQIIDGNARSAPYRFRSISGKQTINREVRNISGRLVAL